MTGIAWSLGGGLLAVVTVVVAFIIVLRQSQSQTDRSDARALGLAQKLDDSLGRETSLEKNLNIQTTNVAELRRELGDKETSIRGLNARVESIEKARVNLANVLKSNPGLVTAVVGAAFDGLREEVSRAQALAAASGGDPRGGEGGPVHAAADDKPPG